MYGQFLVILRLSVLWIILSSLPSLQLAFWIVHRAYTIRSRREGGRQAAAGENQRRGVEGGPGTTSEEVVEKQEGETQSENK